MIVAITCASARPLSERGGSAQPCHRCSSFQVLAAWRISRIRIVTAEGRRIASARAGSSGYAASA